jgi:hypothetical protein
MRKIMVYPGQKVITTEGRTEIVAFTLLGQVYVYQASGGVKLVQVVGDAWGGEHDQTMGIAA